MDNLLNILFPPKCMFCNIGGHLFCPKCMRECKNIYTTDCILCDRPSIFGKTHYTCSKKYREKHKQHSPKTLFCIYEYDGYVRDCIRNAKYSEKQFMGLKILANKGIRNAMRLGYTGLRDTIVVPIPLNKQRQKERGFNQAEIIGKILAKKLDLKMRTKVLQRIKNTKVQFSYNKGDRFKNVHGAFVAKRPADIKGKKILLVDDISTTGATMLAAAKPLYRGGAKEVHCFALAKMLLQKTRRPYNQLEKNQKKP